MAKTASDRLTEQLDEKDAEIEALQAEVDQLLCFDRPLSV